MVSVFAPATADTNVGAVVSPAPAATKVVSSVAVTAAPSALVNVAVTCTPPAVALVKLKLAAPLASVVTVALSGDGTAVDVCGEGTAWNTTCWPATGSPDALATWAVTVRASP